MTRWGFRSLDESNGTKRSGCIALDWRGGDLRPTRTYRTRARLAGRRQWIRRADGRTARREREERVGICFGSSVGAGIDAFRTLERTNCCTRRVWCPRPIGAAARSRSTLGQLAEAVTAGVGTVLLNNMLTDLVRGVVAFVAGRAITEASGTVRLDTIRDYAATGADIVSLGRLTPRAPDLDIGFDLCPWSSGKLTVLLDVL